MEISNTSVYLIDAIGGVIMLTIEKNITIDHEIMDLEQNIFDLQSQIQKEKQKSKPRNNELGKLRYKLERVHEKYCNLYLQKYEITN
jgi:hypothetical protein